MAHFIVIRDVDAVRRARFVEAARGRIDFLGALTVDAFTWGDTAIVWAANSRTPLSRYANEREFALLFGHAILGPGPQRESAEAYANAWQAERVRAGRDALPPVRDGIYAAIAGDEQKIVITTDILGIFPIYHAEWPEVFLAGSSPALFRLHPSFDLEIDPQGLAGLLLTTHVVGGRTLWKGVRRLGAGDALVAVPGDEPVARSHYRVPVSERHYDLTLRGCARVLDGALASAVRRHAPAPGPYALLLSGGRDGRTLAGYLHETGCDVAALTYGRRGEIEMRAAQGVARALGFRHVTTDFTPSGLVDAVRLVADWELGSAGVGAAVQWMSRDVLGGLPPAVISGIFGDQIAGGNSPAWRRVRDVDDLGFDIVFSGMTRLGLPIETARDLLRPEFGGGAVDAAIDDVRRHYEGIAGRPAQRASLFTLSTRFRFNNGGSLWRQSFSGWPIVPFVDREVLAATTAMAPAGIGQRAAQDELIAARFPRLAALPLDRNSFNDAPLRPTLSWRIGDRGRRAVHALRSRSPWGRPRLTDLYFFRLFDINGPAWREVRRAAEPGREAASAILRRETLDALVPPPDRAISLEEPIRQAWGRMTLLGLMLSLRQRA